MTEAKKKTYKLDLFKETLPALHRRDFNFYANRTEEERKEISPLVLMRWVSLAEGNDAPNLIWMVNELVNVDFWNLSKHPELQWKLLALANTGKGQRHTWVAGSKKPTLSKVDKLLLEIYPTVSDEELEILRGQLTRDGLRQMLKDMALPDDEIKPLMDDFKKTNPNA